MSAPNPPAPHPFDPNRGAPAGAPAGGGRPGSSMSTLGKILTGVGVVLLLVAVVFGVLTWRSFSALDETLKDARVARSGERVSLELEEGDKRTLWVRDDAPSAARCRVQDPAGADVRLDDSSSASVSVGGHDYEKIGTIEARKAGSYRMTCTGTEVGVTEGSATSGVFGAVGSMFGAIGSGMLGTLCLVAGILLWIFGRRKHAAPHRY